MKVKFPDKDTRGKNITNTDYIELRDYFACHAMQAMISAWSQNEHWPSDKDGDLEDYEVTSSQAYEFADAMMEARDA